MSLKLSILDAMPICLGETSLNAIANSLDLAQRVEELGFHRYWLTEHHATPSEPATAPEHLIPALMAKTQKLRIGAGGIILNHYSPYKVALNFRTLQALYPDRLDIGIGRSSRSAVVDYALKRHRQAENLDDRDEQVPELLRWLGNEAQIDKQLGNMQLFPEMAAGPSPWMLGASMETALFAAQNGLALAFSGFIAPQQAQASIKAYYRNFRPSSFKAGLDKPKAILAVRCTVAETKSEAERLAMPVRLMMKLRRQDGIFIDGFMTPDEAITQWGGVVEAEALPADGGQWPSYVVGDAEYVAQSLSMMAELTGVDEIMLQDFIPVHALRLRNYELIARQFSL